MDFNLINQWIVDGAYIVDKTTGEKYFYQSETEARLKALAFTIASPIVHTVASIINIAVKLFKIISFYHFWKPATDWETRKADLIHDSIALAIQPIAILALEFAVFFIFFRPYDGMKLYGRIEQFLYDQSFLSERFEPSKSIEENSFQPLSMEKFLPLIEIVKVSKPFEVSFIPESKNDELAKEEDVSAEEVPSALEIVEVPSPLKSFLPKTKEQLREESIARLLKSISHEVPQEPVEVEQPELTPKQLLCQIEGLFKPLSQINLDICKQAANDWKGLPPELDKQQAIEIICSRFIDEFNQGYRSGNPNYKFLKVFEEFIEQFDEKESVWNNFESLNFRFDLPFYKKMAYATYAGEKKQNFAQAMVCAMEIRSKESVQLHEIKPWLHQLNMLLNQASPEGDHFVELAYPQLNVEILKTLQHLDSISPVRLLENPTHPLRKDLNKDLQALRKILGLGEEKEIVPVLKVEEEKEDILGVLKNRMDAVKAKLWDPSDIREVYKEMKELKELVETVIPVQKIILRKAYQSIEKLIEERFFEELYAVHRTQISTTPNLDALEALILSLNLDVKVNLNPGHDYFKSLTAAQDVKEEKKKVAQMIIKTIEIRKSATTLPEFKEWMGTLSDVERNGPIMECYFEILKQEVKETLSLIVKKNQRLGFDLVTPNQVAKRYFGENLTNLKFFN